MTTPRAWLLLFLAVAPGCSEVLVERDGTGGSPSSATSTSSTSSSTTTASSSSTGFDPVLTEAFCAAVGDCMLSCAGAFQTFQAPPCEKEGLALVSCLVDHYEAATCSFTGCEAELQALGACRGGTAGECNGAGYSSSQDYCNSFTECVDGRRLALCTLEPSGLNCHCYLNDILLGTCSGGFSPAAACSLSTGCCTALFGSCSNCI